MSDLLEEELRTKKRALQSTRMQMARYGISAPVNLILDEEDLAREVRAIEQELGRAQTPTIEERRATPLPPRYTTPEPAPIFQQRMAGREHAMQQTDIAHQMNLLAIHRRNLGHLRAQLKELGAYAPPYVRSGVGGAMAEIASHKRILRDMGQDVQDLPGDE